MEKRRGRPPKEPTKRVRVPVSLLEAFKRWLQAQTRKDGITEDKE